MQIKKIGLALVLIVAAAIAYPAIAQNNQATNAQPTDTNAGNAVDTASTDQVVSVQNDGGVVKDPTTIPKAVQNLNLNTNSVVTYSNANYVAAGVGTRNNDRGTVSLRVPSGTSLVDAWVYYQILDSATSPSPQDAYVTVNGIRVKGTLIGSGISPCWSGNGYAYKANIKNILLNTYTTGGAYGITISGLNGAIYSGTSPWATSQFALPSAENANVVIIYGNTGSTVTIQDGYSEVSGGTVSTTVPVGTTLFSSLISDGQVFGVSPAFSKSVSYFDGSATTLLQKVTLNGKDPSITSKATFQGSLSDTDTYVLPSPAGSGATLTWTLASDCVVYQTLIYSNAATSSP